MISLFAMVAVMATASPGVTVIATPAVVATASPAARATASAAVRATASPAKPVVLAARAKPGIPAPAAHAKPVRLDPLTADTLKRNILKGRHETEGWLRDSISSYLATVARRDFEDKTSLTVGRDSVNDLRLDDPSVEPRHLRVTVVGDSFHVEALDQGARFMLKDTELRDATVGPSSIRVGRFMLRLSHQRYPAIIVFDPNSPRFKLYHGLKYFPVDLSYRYVLPLTPNLKPDTVIIMSTRGNARRAVRVGWFDFMVGRTPYRLEATRLLEPGVGEKDIGVFFRDATTGKESYEVGRYVDVEPTADGRFVLDFNLAYNPACAFSDHYNCPIPPPANRLKVAIRAGEMDSHYH